MGKVIHLSEQEAGGSGTGWSGEVDTFAELPPFGDHINEVYLVLNSTGSQWTFNLKRSGFYIADVSQWRKLSNAQFLFNDNEFTVKNSVDQTKQMHLDVSGVSTGTQRTLIVPDKNGTIALLDDITESFISVWNCGLPGVASSTPGLTGKAAVNTNNPAGVLPTCNIYSPGLANSQADPFLEGENRTIKKIEIGFASSAASAVASDVAVNIRIDLYKLEYASNTFVQSFIIPVNPALVSDFNDTNTSGAQYITVDSDIAISAGMYGLVFVNVGSADYVNAVKGLQVKIKLV